MVCNRMREGDHARFGGRFRPALCEPDENEEVSDRERRHVRSRGKTVMQIERDEPVHRTAPGGKRHHVYRKRSPIRMDRNRQSDDEFHVDAGMMSVRILQTDTMKNMVHVVQTPWYTVVPRDFPVFARRCKLVVHGKQFNGDARAQKHTG